jgi:hypothetical protein
MTFLAFAVTAVTGEMYLYVAIYVNSMIGESDRFAPAERAGSADLSPASTDSPRLTLFGREWIVVSYGWSSDSVSPVSSDESVVLDLCLRSSNNSRLKTTRVKRVSLIESIVEQIDSQVSRDVRFPSRQ